MVDNSHSSIVNVVISFTDLEMDVEEREAEAQNLLNQMRELEEVEDVNRILDPNPPEASKALGGFLIGMLTAEVNPANVKKVMGFLGDRLSGKIIEMEVEANGRKLKVKASSQAELISAIEAAQTFIAS
jgi:hypothetical protein